MICFVLILVWTLHAVAGEVELHVETVLATNTSNEIDQRLTDMRSQLERTFQYSSYHLVQEVRRRVNWGQQENFSLPGGRLLQIIPKAFTNDRIALQVMLMEGSAPSPLMNASLSFPNNGMVFFAGRRHQGGVLIIRIGATTEQ